MNILHVVCILLRMISHRFDILSHFVGGSFISLVFFLSACFFLSAFHFEDSTYQVEHLLWWWILVVQLYWHRIQRLIHKAQLEKFPKYEILACHFHEFSLLTSFTEFSFFLYAFYYANSKRIYRYVRRDAF